MPNPEISINRHFLGILTVCCAVLGAIAWLMSEGSVATFWPGALLRTALIVGTFWFALPGQANGVWVRVPLSTLLLSCLALVIVVGSRAPLKIVIPLLVVFSALWWLLRPRAKRRPSRRA